MRRSVIRITQVSVEAEDLSGKASMEREYVYFGRITDEEMRALEKYDSEIQEQYGILRPNGTIRVRRTKNAAGTETFVQTVKTWEAGVFGKKEAQHEVSVDEFNMFKAIADSGMYKRRYFIPFNDRLKWEVDVLLKSDGSFTGWVKVDLEIPEGYTDIIPEPYALPFKLTDAILNQYESRTEEEHAKLKELQATVFDPLKN